MFNTIIILFFLFTCNSQASTSPATIDSLNFYFPKQNQSSAQKADKILSSKFGQWIVKRAIKKVEKKQQRYAKKVARKKAKKRDNWQPKKQKIDDLIATVVAILLIIGLLVGLGGLVTLPFNPALARDLFYISGSFMCAAGGCVFT